VSSVQTFPSLPQPVPSATFECWQPEPAEQLSAVHGLPSSQFGAAPPVHVPAWQRSFVVQALPSEQELPVSGFAAHPPGSPQMPAWHWSADPVQSSALPPVQDPAAHDSPTVQVLPSLQPVPPGSFAEQFFDPSLHDPAQLPSVVLSGRQGLPACCEQVPELHVSVPLQKVPSAQPVPFGSLAVQFFPPSLHDAAQLPSVVLSGRHGSPACWEQVPALQVSVPLQKVPSTHPVPFGSAALQAVPASLQEVEQFASVVTTGHGLPGWMEQVPPPQVSTPLQNTPSSHVIELFV
jgi:hypothetical protein